MSTPTTQPALAGSVAVVTGGGRGIGRVLALALAGAGAAVGLIARSPDQLAESVQLIEAAGGVAAAASADLSDPEAAATAVDKLRHEFGPVDLLVNNAGISGPIGPGWEVPEQDWWRTIEVNLRSVDLCSRLVLPEMVARRRGRIVNVTSQAGVFRWPLASAYSVSKAAVVSSPRTSVPRPDDTGSASSAFIRASCRSGLANRRWQAARRPTHRKAGYGNGRATSPPPVGGRSRTR